MSNTISPMQPSGGYLRLKHILRPAGPIPISKSKFYADIKRGIYPPPIKLGRVSVWRDSDIIQAIESASHNGGQS